MANMLSAATSEVVAAVGKFSCCLSNSKSKLCKLHCHNPPSLARLAFLCRTFAASSSQNQQGNHYEVLGIKKNASNEDIRNAFLTLSKHYHPDLNSGNPKNHNKFVQINEAYSVLSKPLLRREYDHKMINQHHYQNIPRQYSASSGFSPSSYRFHERQGYDPQFYANRDRSQDEYYAKKPYYGVEGISKVSDRTIVYVCLGILLFGVIFHFFVVKTLSDNHIENLNARDRKTHKTWTDANNPNYISEQIKKLKAKVAEEEAKKQNKD